MIRDLRLLSVRRESSVTFVGRLGWTISGCSLMPSFACGGSG